MSSTNPLAGWAVPRESIRYVGSGLRRPECLLALVDGTVLAADARGGVMRIDADGSQTLLGVPEVGPADGLDGEGELNAGSSLPNGIALLPDGDIVIANIGSGAIERLSPAGELTSVVVAIDGEPLGLVNFVTTDSRGRTWFTVTTRLIPWTRASNERLPDGYIGLIDSRGTRVVADGFVGTNEIRFDADEEYLYVVESNARRISRLRVLDDRLVDRELFGPEDLGGVPDGFAFDVVGNLWITLVSADRLVALTPEGELLTLLDDGNPQGVSAFEEHFKARTVTPDVVAAVRGTIAPLMASVTFGGPDLRTIHLGSLMGDRIPVFRSPVPGLPLQHWRGRPA